MIDLGRSAKRAQRAPLTQKPAAINRLLFDLKQSLKVSSVKQSFTVLGLTGLPGSGKDSTAHFLARNYKFARVAFADALRDELCAAYQMFDLRWLTNRVSKEVPASALAIARSNDAEFVRAMWNDGFDLGDPRSPRELMQLWGTEYRRAHDPNYWVRRAEERLIELRTQGIGNVVFTDVRFPNEAHFVRSQRGLLWEIHRVHSMAASEHASDTSMTREVADAVIHNHGTLEQLELEIDRVMQLTRNRAQSARQET